MLIGLIPPQFARCSVQKLNIAYSRSPKLFPAIVCSFIRFIWFLCIICYASGSVWIHGQKPPVLASFTKMVTHNDVVLIICQYNCKCFTNTNSLTFNDNSVRYILLLPLTEEETEICAGLVHIYIYIVHIYSAYAYIYMWVTELEFEYWHPDPGSVFHAAFPDSLLASLPEASLSEWLLGESALSLECARWWH